nr:hypothetical protein [Agrobacterium tumefaciens]
MENIEFEDEQSYRRRYLKKLNQWHDYAPIPYDLRLWQTPKD